MNIDFEKIKKIIVGIDKKNYLEATLEKFQFEKEPMTKEEAIIRFLIDLPRSG